MVDMTTSQPSLAVEIYEQAKKKGVFSLDAPGSHFLCSLTCSVGRRRGCSRRQAVYHGGWRQGCLREGDSSVPGSAVCFLPP